VALAEAAGEVAMFPRMIEVKTGILTAGVVADPFIVGVNVRGLGVTLAVGIFLLWGSLAVVLVVVLMVVLGRLNVLCGPGRRRAVTGNVAVADVSGLRSLLMLLAVVFFLRESRNGTE
jgi:hypothetical protein